MNEDGDGEGLPILNKLEEEALLSAATCALDSTGSQMLPNYCSTQTTCVREKHETLIT